MGQQAWCGIRRVGWQLFIILLPVAVTFSLWTLYQRENKHLAIYIDSESSIFSGGSKKIEGLELNYKTKKIDSLSIVELTVACDGNSAVRKEDFASPLRITFQGEIINGPKTIRKTPLQLEPCYRLVEAGIVEISPMLFNQGDEFTFRVDVANLKSKQLTVNADGRIVGIAQINPIDRRIESIQANKYLKYMLIVNVLVCLVSISLVVYSNAEAVKKKFFRLRKKDIHPVD